MVDSSARPDVRKYPPSSNTSAPGRFAVYAELLLRKWDELSSLGHYLVVHRALPWLRAKRSEASFINPKREFSRLTT
jgi:hypothetical protein